MIDKLYKKAQQRGLTPLELIAFVLIAICFKLIDTCYYVPRIKFFTWRTQRLKRKTAQLKLKKTDWPKSTQSFLLSQALDKNSVKSHYLCYNTYRKRLD